VSTIAVVPVKQFARAKQRLTEGGFSVSRRALVEAMLTDVLMALRRADTIDAAIVVTQDRDAERLAVAWEATAISDPEETSHNAAAALGVAEALRRGATSVLLVPGDCPLLDPPEVDALVARARSTSVVVVPDRHGQGTNGLLLTPPGAIGPSFGPDSCERHVDLAQAAGVSVDVAKVASLALDIDTVQDLEALRAAFADHTGNAAHTRGMLARLLGP
jgi:2-phospho-L-lactate/phosphoenolpyruvate guanylyltransferase